MTLKPTITATGTAVVTNPAVPGLEIIVTLPKLSTAAYTVTLSGETVIYTYIDPNTNHEITFTLPLPEEGYREAEVTSVPTTTKGGIAVVSHPEIPGIEIVINLPKLSGNDYTLTHDETSAIYTYIDDETGFTVDIIISLPETGYSAPTLASSPTANETGTATVTHPDLPDLEVTLELPKLNSEDYVVTVSGETVVYTYTDVSKDVRLEVTIPLPEDGYNDPIVTVSPTPTTKGVAIITHPDLPGLEIRIEVPVLSVDNYDVNVAGDEVIYTTTTPEGEIVTVTIALPDEGYDQAVITDVPSVTSTGTATVTHPDLPGATIEVELPTLNGEDYDVVINAGDDGTTGDVLYTYTDADTHAEVTIEVPYDYNDLTWDVNEKPTLEDGGTITGTNSDLPGAMFELELPALNGEDYDVTDNNDGTLTYTLKDKTYGNFTFTVPSAANEINLWWLIIIEIIIIIGIAVVATLKILHDKKASKESTASMHALPLLFFAKYIPNGAIAIIIVLAVIILLGGAFLLYLFLFRTKSDETKEETEKTVEKK